MKENFETKTKRRVVMKTNRLAVPEQFLQEVPSPQDLTQWFEDEWLKKQYPNFFSEKDNQYWRELNQFCQQCDANARRDVLKRVATDHAVAVGCRAKAILVLMRIPDQPPVFFPMLADCFDIGYFDDWQFGAIFQNLESELRGFVIDVAVQYAFLFETVYLHAPSFIEDNILIKCAERIQACLEYSLSNDETTVLYEAYPVWEYTGVVMGGTSRCNVWENNDILRKVVMRKMLNLVQGSRSCDKTRTNSLVAFYYGYVVGLLYRFVDVEDADFTKKSLLAEYVMFVCSLPPDTIRHLWSHRDMIIDHIEEFQRVFRQDDFSNVRMALARMIVSCFEGDEVFSVGFLEELRAKYSGYGWWSVEWYETQKNRTAKNEQNKIDAKKVVQENIAKRDEQKKQFEENLSILLEKIKH